jgi:hypothetical protein
MQPLFDRECELVAWLDPLRNIFDTQMNWVAFISSGHAWSAETGNWLGAVPGLICLDQSGRVVAWNPRERVAGTARPAKPARAAKAARPGRPAVPAQPARPGRPATPSGGWSESSFYAWLSQ